MVLGEEVFLPRKVAIRRPRSMKRKPYNGSLVSAKSYALPCCSYFCGGRKDQPAQAMLEHVESFLLEVTAGKAKNILSQSRYI